MPVAAIIVTGFFIFADGKLQCNTLYSKIRPVAFNNAIGCNQQCNTLYFLIEEELEPIQIKPIKKNTYAHTL